MSPAESNNTSKSTGPRTPEGKQKASHNALRHGLTGRVVVMPWEDMDAYNAFCKELMAELAPEGLLEKQYAQTFCDTQWRLNRAASYEEGIFLLDQVEQRQSIDVGHPQANNALMAARAFRDNSKVFTNLTLYEQRLRRTLNESLRLLEEHQRARKASQASEPPAEKSAAQPLKTKAAAQASDKASAPVPIDEFVFSTTSTHAQTQPPPPDPTSGSSFENQNLPDQRAA